MNRPHTQTTSSDNAVGSGAAIAHSRRDPLNAPVPDRLHASWTDLPALAWTSARAWTRPTTPRPLHSALAVVAAPLHAAQLVGPLLLGQVLHHDHRALLVLEVTDRRRFIGPAASAPAVLGLTLAQVAAAVVLYVALAAAGVPTSVAGLVSLAVLVAVIAIGLASVIRGSSAPRAQMRATRVDALQAAHRHRLVTFVGAWPQQAGAGTALVRDVLAHLDPDVDLALHASTTAVGTWYATLGFQNHGHRVMTRTTS